MLMSKIEIVVIAIFVAVALCAFLWFFVRATLDMLKRCEADLDVARENREIARKQKDVLADMRRASDVED
jgi:hypothetical protein